MQGFVSEVLRFNIEIVLVYNGIVLVWGFDFYLYFPV